jgi:hypothetical protein
VKGVTWCFSAFFVVAIMGMLMMTFRSSLRPTVFVEDIKFINAPMEFVEEHEVEYAEPSQREQPQDEAYGIDEAKSTDGVPVVTGFAVGDAATEASNGEGGSLGSENPVDEVFHA